MEKKLKVYHNPSCSKSRLCLDFLSKEGVLYEIIPYLKCPLSKEELQALLNKLGMKPSELVRKNELLYKEFLAKNPCSEEAILELMLQHPKLIERPIVESDYDAVVARPLEEIERLITNMKRKR